jgi:hypothetical protein
MNCCVLACRSRWRASLRAVRRPTVAGDKPDDALASRMSDGCSMTTRRTTQLVHEGQYVTEVEVESIIADDGWSPYLSLADAYKLDDVRQALRDIDLKRASQIAKIFKLTPPMGRGDVCKSCALLTAYRGDAVPTPMFEPQPKHLTYPICILCWSTCTIVSPGIQYRRDRNPSDRDLCELVCRLA